MLCKPGQHFWANFFTIVESEHHVTPADAGQSPVGTCLAFDLPA